MIKRVSFFAFLYLLLTLILFYFLTPHRFFTQKMDLVFKDGSIPDRLHTRIVEDTNGQRVVLARLFENKGTFILEDILVSLARSTDPVFFFSLYNEPYYGDSYYFLFSGIFFPLFVVASITLIRKWTKVKKKYFFLLPLLGISLFIDMLFLPYTAPVKLIPLFITVQLITFFGMYELWVRK